MAWAASRAGVSRVVGFESVREHGDAARRAGAVTALTSSPEAVVDQSELVVLAAPPAANLELLGQLSEPLKRGSAAVTDVTSVQLPLLERARELDLASRVVASHPFCGTHESGFAAARSDMLAGSAVYVSIGSAGDDVTSTVMDFWRRLGASPAVVEAVWHDEVLAWTSHLPQAISSALAVTLASDAPAGGVFGAGGLDTTRLAASSVEMWRDLFVLNQHQILRAVDSFQRHLGLLREALDGGDKDGIAAWLEKGAGFRRDIQP